MDPRLLPNFGEPMLIDELVTMDRSHLEGKSVRITGKLSQYDCTKSLATLAGPRSVHSLSINTRLIEPFHACLGELVQVIGELEFQTEHDDVILLARVVRCVNSIDLKQYNLALEKQRSYLLNRT